jgi:hypothetical protein
MSARLDTIDELRSAAEALGRAAVHCRIAANQHEQQNTPRMAAHALAARGGQLRASGVLDEVARRYAGRPGSQLRSGVPCPSAAGNPPVHPGQ